MIGHEHTASIYRQPKAPPRVTEEQILRQLRNGFVQLSDVDESERNLAEWKLITDWANERGIRYYSEGNILYDKGGHEHDIRFRKPFYCKKTK